MEMKDRKKAAETAENRMAMIAPLLAPNLSREDVSNMKERISESFQVSVRTLERYCKNYLEYGFEGLFPQGKSAESKYKIPRELLDEAIRLRRELPSRSIPTIIRILELEGKAEPDNFAGRFCPRRILLLFNEDLSGQRVRLPAFPA